MKKIIMMAAMTVAVLSASAQSRFEPGTLTIQPKTGGVGAMLSNTPDVDIEGLSNSIDATAIGAETWHRLRRNHPPRRRRYLPSREE